MREFSSISHALLIRNCYELRIIISVRIGYILKRYPRYSETFVVNEILAHEAAGLDIEIFALRPPCDTHFQNIISQVRASVNYIRKPIQGRT
jgi:hypothetical protein